jgi:CRISPR-associated endonuclease Csn1
MVEIHVSPQRYVLGLDIGASSIGWACLQLRNGQPCGIIATGVRLFDAGMSGSSSDFERGREESNSAARRQARLARRQFHRRASRHWQVFQILQQAGLLPPERVDGRRALSDYLARLNRTLNTKYCPSGDHASAQLLVYRIRAQAVKERIEAFALGRAFLHLAKRRGFNSNLRGAPKDDEESGTVKPAIKSLASELSRDDKTLGQFLADQNPFEKGVPGGGIRKRWTGREMYLAEFERIWDKQAPFHAQLTDSLRKKIRKAIFFQRPLRSAKGLVGKCSLEPKKRRLAAAHPLAQEVRMLQFLNHVRIKQRGEVDRPLDDVEYELALNTLRNCGRLSLKGFREAIRMPKGAKLNFEGDDDQHARGMGTVAELREILGARWDELDEQQQERLFYEVLSFNKRDALIRRAKVFWKFDDGQADLLADATLEPGYANHSRQALLKLREKLSQVDHNLGRRPTYAEAKLLAYPDAHAAGAVFERLPPVVGHATEMRSPAVTRALTEVRKVVNELIARFGKPEVVRIELARDLKRSKKERKKAEDLIKDRTKERRKALTAIREEFKQYPEKAGYDRGIEMYLLAEECNWVCPYTGEEIHSVRDLIGDRTRFDVEHIYPRRYLDDSFGNKTLCLHEENRNRKRDRLPAIAYADVPARYQEILARVKSFRGPAAAKKLARFQAQQVDEEFASRQLNDTRYAGVAAADYIGLLYGGRNDTDGKQRVSTLTGGLTAALRGQWKLNQILGIDGEKNRADHRQHAIDAIVAACTDMGTVRALQTAAGEAWQQGRPRGLPQIDPPWLGLLDEARNSIHSILVSHRQDRRLNGPLHADTNYAIQSTDGKERSKVRKPLSGLSETEINGEAIIDAVVRSMVQSKYEELKKQLGANKKPSELFNSPENHPCLLNRDGSKTPIHSVRIWAEKKAVAVRKGDPTRNVAATAGSNFCSRVLAVLDDQGHEIGWTDQPVSRLEAMRNRNEPAADPRDRFSLFIHEFVLMPDQTNVWRLYRILNLSEGDIEVRLHFDGRTSDEVKKSKERIRIRGGALSERRFRKVSVSPTGLLSDALTDDEIDLTALAKWSPPKQTRKNDRKKKDR